MSAAAPLLIPPGVVTQEFRTPSTVRRGVIAGVVGNMLEWYDFALFGFFAAQIGAHFFPARNPTASLLAAYGTFAAGFLMRPIGGAFFGWVGDRFGRKQALLWSVLAMALPSFFIGVLPSEATIGLTAPVLLLVCRLLQGLAVGGEYMASSVFLVEGAEPGKRGLMGAWSPFGCFAGTLLGSAAGLIVNTMLSPNAVMAYGWRIPFIVGLVVALGGIVIRRNFVEKVPHQPPAKSPIGESFRYHWRTILHLMMLVAGLSVGFYTTFVYSAPRLSATRIAAADSITVQVDVRNAGPRSGDEVVQMYVRDDVASVTRPLRELRGFERITLEPGQSRTVSFTLRPDQLAFYNQRMQRIVEPGVFTVWVGASSADEERPARFEVIGEAHGVGP